MAVKKNETAGYFTEEQAATVALLEERIDAQIRTNYVGGSVIVNIERYPHAKVQQELIRRYTEAGWTISFHSDQREGEWIELK